MSAIAITTTTLLKEQKKTRGNEIKKETQVDRKENNRMEKIQETFNKDLEELKSKQTMINNTINEI